MKLKTSLFDRTIFLNTLQRYWIAFIAYLCVLGACILIPLINSLQEAGWYPTNLPYYASLLQLLDGSIMLVIMVNFFAVAVAATLLFSYLYNARHTGMMASLPIKRETMYLSVSAAAIVGMTACNVILMALALLIEVIYGQVSLIALGILLLVSVLTIITFFGMAAFCCMLTGNIFAGPVVYGIFNVLSIGTELLINALLQKIVFGLSYAYNTKTMFLSPIMQIGNSVNFHYDIIRDAADNWIDYTWEMQGLGVLAIYTVAGLVFLILGMLLYKNRRMETAGDTISIEILKPVFRFCMTVGGGLLFTTFINEAFYEISPAREMAAVYIAVLLIIGGILGYFISQMLITKTVNVFRKGWKVLGIYAIAIILITAAIETDLFGYERYVPDANDVAEVSISGYTSPQLTFDEPENIESIVKLHSNIIANKSLHDDRSGAYEANYITKYADDPASGLQTTSVQITYTLQNEKTVIRRYTITYGADEIRNSNSEIRAYETLLNTTEAIEERYMVDYPVTIDNVDSGWVDYVAKDTYEGFHFSDFSPSELVRLYNECILPDIADGKLGVIDIIEDKDYAQSKYNCTIGLDVFEKTESSGYGGLSYIGYKSINVYPTLESSRTLAFLKEYGIEPAVVYDSMVADGFDYNDLGRYKVDGEEDITYRGPMEVTTEAAGVIIGDADGPTQIVVTG